MPRSSPQTERLLHVLELLATSDRGGRTLAELARSLGVDKATCRPMLMELTGAGYLIRDPRRKTFHLGPRWVAIGRAAEHAVNVVDLARHALAALADRTGICAMAVIASADELIVADLIPPANASARARRALGLRAGDRIPFEPPMGAVLAAWGTPDDLRRWRDRSPAGDPEYQDRLDGILEVVRARGFGVEQFPPAPDTLAAVIEQSAGTYLGAHRSTILGQQVMDRLDAEVMVGEIDPRAAYWPVSINAPVLDANDVVAMAVCLIDLEGPVEGARVTELGEAVAATARDIGAQAGRVVRG
jgi:DNA-binding IclR family transcriptional regulator